MQASQIVRPTKNRRLCGGFSVRKGGFLRRQAQKPAAASALAGLDHAALRRFDLKVKFDFLRPDQAGALFDRYCAQLELPAARAEASTRVRRLQNLTPGDFAVVARQHRFRRFGSTRDLLSALEAECTIKSNGRTTIGFM